VAEPARNLAPRLIEFHATVSRHAVEPLRNRAVYRRSSFSKVAYSKRLRMPKKCLAKDEPMSRLHDPLDVRDMSDEFLDGIRVHIDRPGAYIRRWQLSEMVELGT
jgi:hypothetical protein